MAIPIKSFCFPWHQLLMVSFPSKTAFHLLFGKQEGFPGKAKMKELWTPLEGFPIVSSGSTGPGFNASGRELTSRRGRGVQHQELWRLHGACGGDHEAFCVARLDGSLELPPSGEKGGLGPRCLLGSQFLVGKLPRLNIFSWEPAEVDIFCSEPAKVISWEEKGTVLLKLVANRVLLPRKRERASQSVCWVL